MDKMTWATVVKETMDELINQGAKADDDLEKALLAIIGDKCKQHFDTISLARIATALYEMAGLTDEFDEDSVLGELMK